MTDDLRTMDALRSLCDPASPVLLAFTEAAGAVSHAAAIRHKERPEPPSKAETEAALIAILAGKRPDTDSPLLRAADRRAAQSFKRFMDTPATTLPELAFKVAAFLCVVPGGIPPQIAADAERIAGGEHG